MHTGNKGSNEKEVPTNTTVHAPPAAFPDPAQGRSPGSQVLICRLPMIAHSGILANPHSLTVAGAAQALHLFPV